MHHAGLSNSNNEQLSSSNIHSNAATPWKCAREMNESGRQNVAHKIAGKFIKNFLIKVMLFIEYLLGTNFGPTDTAIFCSIFYAAN